MRGKRLALVSLLAATALVAVAEPVAAQSASANLINELNGKLLYIAIPITLLVEVILFYTVLKFRNNDTPKPTKENRRLEITWTIATAIILLFVGVASYSVLANPNITHMADDPVAPNENDVVVHAEAYQWGWNMSYPEEGINTGTEIVLPNDRDVYFRITSRDVIHSFGVPELGLKQDAIPGQTNVIKTHTTKTGQYQGYCMEYCGQGHSAMYFDVKIVSQEEYQRYLEEQKSSSEGSSGGNSSASGGNSTTTASAALVATN